ncbi:TetR family transcriptional regulator [Knoellia remsis]|uniref:TetR family transcriptional regulator n=1 Tax=Knoellia remsis TaxID=407159 RepID=A0A2T0UYD0_9MICO|nr:TetR/AcrR family transcriptional regulator [Knoellia remsis]PRY62857.1 TetR family transcriptional regulator [Knoellia remsis]
MSPRRPSSSQPSSSRSSSNPKHGGSDGRSRRWADHKAERRQHILDAALVTLDELGPGVEIHVQDIADKAGMHRTVVYRHFTDRAELDQAVQEEICLRLAAAIEPAVRLEGTPLDIVRRIVTAYVSWTIAHPALMDYLERDAPGASDTPLERTLEDLARSVAALMGAFLDVLGHELDADDTAALDPWIFGLIGGVREGVRRWLQREVLAPGAEHFTEMVSQSVWFQIRGFADQRGIVFSSIPVEELVAQFAAIQNAPTTDGPLA